MSKKNSKATRQRHLEAAKQKDKETRQKREQKIQKKKAADTKLSVAAGTTKKFKKKGIRIKKNVVIRGIKVKDAESKKKVKEVLAAEEAMREMMVDAPPQPVPAAKKAKAGKGKKAKQPAGEKMVVG